MKWTEEQTVYFINEFVKHECLYNANCPEYGNKQSRHEALTELSLRMGIPDFGPRDAYRKIRNLKSTYFQEIKKMSKSNKTDAAAGTSSIYTPNVKWFNILHDALMATNISEENMDLTCKTEMVAPIEFQQVDTYLEQDIDTVSNEKDEDEVAGPSAAFQTKSDANKGKHARTNKNNPRKRIIRDYDNLLAKIQNVANSVNNPIVHSENEFDLFGKSIAAQLKNMRLDKAIEAQRYIQNYLSDLRLKSLKDTNT